jgi:hypothetical protein
VARTSEGRKRLSVERYAGGMSQRDIAYGVEKAGGQFVLSQSTGSELTDTVNPEDEAGIYAGLTWPP